MMVSKSEKAIFRSNLKLELVHSPSQPEQDEPTQHKDLMMFPSLGHRSSILSLTLDEIQSKRGKSLGSMNMDEFLASIWSVEEGSSSSLLASEDEPASTHKAAAPAAAMGHGSLLRQASFSIPTLLCNKTVDEVWLQIHKDQPEQEQNGSSNINYRGSLSHQQTLGEMTLEDFLGRAGIVPESVVLPSQCKSVTGSAFLKAPPGFGNSTPALDSSYGMKTVTGFGLISNINGPGNNLLGNGLATNCTMMYGGQSSCNVFDGKSCGFMDVFETKNRRIIDRPAEVVVERRKRRMIKNRESAARSRARKQAYTVELEVELNQLKEENEMLKKIVAEMEEKRRKEVMSRKQAIKTGMAADEFRAERTVSMAW